MPKLKNPKAKGNKFEAEVCRRINAGVGQQIATVDKALGADVKVLLNGVCIYIECKSPSTTLEKAFEQSEAFVAKTEDGIAAAARREKLGGRTIQVMMKVGDLHYLCGLAWHLDIEEISLDYPINVTITLQDLILCLKGMLA